MVMACRDIQEAVVTWSNTNEPEYNIFYKTTYATSIDSDQTDQSRGLS